MEELQRRRARNAARMREQRSALTNADREVNNAIRREIRLSQDDAHSQGDPTVAG
jgi:hypothetical protein